MNSVTVTIKRLSHAPESLPQQASTHAAGYDLQAAVTDTVIIEPGARALIPTGFAIALPIGYEAQVRPRSGLALKHGLTLVNAPGTIDADYRGEIGVIMINHGTEPFTVTRGMRIAQLVIAPVTSLTWDETETLPETDRGTGGFGSTGVRPSVQR